MFRSSLAAGIAANVRILLLELTFPGTSRYTFIYRYDLSYTRERERGRERLPIGAEINGARAIQTGEGD